MIKSPAKPIIIGTAVLLCTLVLITYYSQLGRPAGNDKPALDISSISSSDSDVRDVDALATSPGSKVSFTSGSGHTFSDPIYAGYRWDPQKPAYAADEQDAQWLEAHGYPGPDAEVRLMGLSAEGLKMLADNGNQPAQAWLAYQLAKMGAPQAEVQEILLQSAAAGSVYALKMGGDIYSTVDGYRDPTMARAYYGLQARSGDHSGVISAYIVDQAMAPDVRLRSEMLEELMWRNLLTARTIWGGSRSTNIGARPGFTDFLHQSLKPGRTKEE